MYTFDLCHLGDNCAPGIIMSECLNIRKKTLFMLGFYNFNDILKYLTLCDTPEYEYEMIYDRQYLNPYYKPQNWFNHTLFQFTLNHDYKMVNNEIINSDRVKEWYDIKIKNFREMLMSDKPVIFINFTQNIDELNIAGMVNWLTNNVAGFYLMIFTDKPYTVVNQYPNVFYITLDVSYVNWFEKEEHVKIAIYKDIYTKFIDTLDTAHIEHNFPKTYEYTHYAQLTNNSTK